MQAPPMNPNLPGLTLGQVVVLSEKLHTVGGEGFLFCHERCITHFGDDSIPYHNGEKSCMDRCMSKLYNGFEMARSSRQEFEETVRKGGLPFGWMKTLTAQQ